MKLILGSLIIIHFTELLIGNFLLMMLELNLKVFILCFSWIIVLGLQDVIVKNVIENDELIEIEVEHNKDNT